jgi:heat shock protein HtpX
MSSPQARFGKCARSKPTTLHDGAVAEPSTATCPECGSVTVRVPHGQPWCPDCEWNLHVYDPALVPPRGWYRLEKLGHRWASRLDRRLHTRLSVENPRRPGWTKAHLCLVAISAAIVCLVLATFLTGHWLDVVHASIWTTALGTLLILLALLLRPHLYRAPHRRERLAPGRHPRWSLVEHVADRNGTRPPDYIVLDNARSRSRPSLMSAVLSRPEGTSDSPSSCRPRDRP